MTDNTPTRQQIAEAVAIWRATEKELTRDPVVEAVICGAERWLAEHPDDD